MSKVVHSRSCRKFLSRTASVAFASVCFGVVEPRVALADGSSCYNGSCESVTATGRHVTYTTTYASTPHCNQLLGTTQYDQKGLIATQTLAPAYISGCSTRPMALSWNTTLNQDDLFYGSAYFNSGWQGIATVNVHA